MAITAKDIERIRKAYKKKRNYIEWYGMKKGLLSYLGLPDFLPLKAHLQHGAGMLYRNGVPDPLVLDTKYKKIFLCNSYQKNICEKYLPDKEIYVIGSIYPLYRQRKGIVQDENAQGTLFFPAHSTEQVKAVDNIEKTLKILSALPDELKPIKVSIYYKDLLNGLHKIYEENGYETFTNGPRSDPSFIDKFYKTLKTVKYTMGTTMGSQTYYAIEMGIPYFIMGDIPKIVNEGNKYYPEGAITSQNRAKYGYTKHDHVRSLFVQENLTDKLTITPEQKEFVLKSIGYYEKIPKQQLKNIVIKSYFFNG